jgi:hypothetical protein
MPNTKTQPTRTEVDLIWRQAGVAFNPDIPES